MRNKKLVYSLLIIIGLICGLSRTITFSASRIQTNEKVELVQIESPKIEQFIVCIDPGHQRKANLQKEPIGPGSSNTKIKVSGGTTGVVTKKPEYVLTLEAGLILKEQLEAKGMTVVMTRTTNDVNISNKERAEIANKAKVDLFIRIHADGSNSSSTKGASILIPSKKNPYIKDTCEDSKKVAEFVLKRWKQNEKIKVNGLSYRDDITGFNWSKAPVFLPEMGFMTNKDEDQKLSNPKYLKMLIQEIADGIEDYAKFKKNKKFD
ncbi:N-acetylmuramoyl-L-alanine amidase [Lutibacter sp. B2]|nr:N-acetylmuramoyl-L-alanine amidase [Lutibacter sp. B2]